MSPDSLTASLMEPVPHINSVTDILHCLCSSVDLAAGTDMESYMDEIYPEWPKKGSSIK